jgi:hypothetical protein
MENDLIRLIVKRLKVGIPAHPSGLLAWQIRKLAELGDLNRDVIKLISIESGAAEPLLNKIIEQAGISDVKTLDVALGKAADDGYVDHAVPLEQDTAIYDTLRAYQRGASNSLGKIHSGMLSGAGEAYRDIIAQTAANVLAGVATVRDSMAKTAAKWAERGLPAMKDKAGRNWSVEAYSRMVVNTTMNNVANDMQWRRMDSYELDLIEVSSHAGARPLCAPYQGRIFSRNGKTKGYKRLAETSYGQPAGLFGINCRHVSYPYIPGVSVQTYFPYPAAENAKVYAQSQQQRALERAIRKAKGAAQAAKEAGATDVAKDLNARVRTRQKQMRAFIDETGRTRRYDREKKLT